MTNDMNEKVRELEKDMIALQTEVRIQFKEVIRKGQTIGNNINGSFWGHNSYVGNHTCKNGIGIVLVQLN